MLYGRKQYLLGEGHRDGFPELVQAAVDAVPPPLLDHLVRDRGSLRIQKQVVNTIQ